MTDYKQLCAELADVLAQYVSLPDDPEAVALLRRARAALAEPEPEKPSLKEQALEALEHIVRYSSTDRGAETIRSALEQLPDQPASGGDCDHD